MDGEPGETTSGPGPGGQNPGEADAQWRRPDTSGAAEPGPAPDSAKDHRPARRGWIGRAIAAVRDWWNNLQFVQMWHVVAIAAVLATAGFGGLDQVDKTPSTFKLGEAFDTGEFTIVVHRASLVQRLEGGGGVIAKEKPGRMYLGIIADVTNHANMPDVVDDMFTVPDVADAQNPSIPKMAHPTIYRTDDGSELNALQPGLTEKVAAVWSVPAAAVPPGAQVSVRVPYRVFSHGLVLYGEGWVDGRDTATTVVPVEVRQ